jgi:hypothetical protein
MTIARAGCITAILLSSTIGVCAQAQQVENDGYARSAGQVTKNPFGLCWRTSAWTAAKATTECDPDLVPKPAPRRAEAPPAPPVVPAPAPAVLPAMPVPIVPATVPPVTPAALPKVPAAPAVPAGAGRLLPQPTAADSPTHTHNKSSLRIMRILPLAAVPHTQACEPAESVGFVDPSRSFIGSRRARRDRASVGTLL